MSSLGKHERLFTFFEIENRNENKNETNRPVKKGRLISFSMIISTFVRALSLVQIFFFYLNLTFFFVLILLFIILVSAKSRCEHLKQNQTPQVYGASGFVLGF